MSDPYIVFWDSTDDEKKTEVSENNLNPILYHCEDLEFEADCKDDLPPFLLDITQTLLR